MIKFRQTMIQALLDALYESDEIAGVHLFVLCQMPNGEWFDGVNVPPEHVKQGAIQLNVTPNAIQSMTYSEEEQSYLITAAFGGKPFTCIVPINLIASVLGFPVDKKASVYGENFDVFMQTSKLNLEGLSPTEPEPAVKKKPNHLKLVTH
jgi:stringent starvation protein B